MSDSRSSGKRRVSLRTFFTSMLPLFVLAHFTHHIITAIGAPLLPMIRSSFDLSYTQSGLLLTAFTLSYGIGHLPAGWLSDRINPTIMLLVGTAGVGLAGILFGLAPSFGLLVAANALIGLAGSGYHPASSYLISRVTRPDQRGAALGVHVIGGSSSYFLAPLVAGGIALALGWRSTYIVLSVPTLILGMVFVFLLRRAGAGNTKEHAEARQESESGRGARFWAWLISFLVLTTVGGALAGSVIGFIPLLLVDSHGIRPETAAGLQALIFSGGFWVAPLAGYLSDRVGRIPLIIGGSILAVPIILLIPRVPMGFGMYALLVLMGVYIFVRMPVSESFLYTHAPPKRRTTILGIYFLAASGGGGVFTPLIGWMADARGFTWTFTTAALAFAVITVISGVLLGVLRPTITANAESRES